MKEEKIWAVKDGFSALRNGTIFRLNWRNKGKCVEVKQTKDKFGYLRFNCNGKNPLVHRFIADCFIENPQNLPCINHKDENPSNNHVENLEWCTYKYNNNYGLHNKRVTESKSKKVLQYTKNGEFVKEWCSINEIQRVLGYATGYISACCLGKHEQAYGFIWKHK